VRQRIRSVGLAALTDGKTVVVGSDRPITTSDGMIRQVIREEGTVSLWNIAGRKERHRIDVPHPVLGVTLSPDGKTVAYSQEQTVHLLDRDSRKETRRLELPEGRPFRLVFSPNGKVLAVGGRNDIQLWNVASGQLLLPRAGHSAEGDTIAFTANGKQLLSTCQETGVARLWDVENGRQLRRFAGDWAPLGVVAPSLDGKLLASSDTFNSMSIWDTATGKRIYRLQVQKKPPDKYAHYIRRLVLSPDGKRLTSISDNNTRRDHGMTILVQEAATGKELSRLKETIPDDKRGRDRYPTLSPDGQMMAETDDRTVRLRDVCTGKLWRLLQAEKLQPKETLSTPVVFSSDGRLLACVGAIRRSADGRVQESRIHVWELATGKEIACLAAPNTQVIAFAADGRILATASPGHSELPIRESAIHLWDVVGGAEVGRFRGHGTPVASLAFSPDEQRLASGLTDSTILIWDLKPSLQRVCRARSAVRAEDLPRLWAELASEDARQAQASLWTLASAPSRALPYLEQRLTPARAVGPDRLRRLIADLESEQFAVRKSASEQLRQLDLLAEPALREALKGRPPLESRRRIEELLADFRGPAATDERRRVVRAVTVLEHAKSESARRLLRKLAAVAPEARLTREVRAALQRLQSRQRDGSP
jgi:WD40 repeat protein